MDAVALWPVDVASLGRVPPLGRAFFEDSRGVLGERHGVRLSSSCCFEARMVLASAVFFLVRCSWRATLTDLASHGCWVWC